MLRHHIKWENGMPDDLPNKSTNKYDVLVVDPPWAYGSDTGRPNRTAEAHYQTIGRNGREINRRTGAGVDGIVDSVPVQEWAAPDSHLYLWTTNPKLPFAFHVMEAWGFVYKTTLTWVKTTGAGQVHGGGMGWFYRGATEHVLFGVKGNKAIPSASRRANVIMAPPTGHSVKPDAFYAMLDGIYATERKIDIFARRSRSGWDVYGNEVEHDIFSFSPSPPPTQENAG
jgi:N6-adenosine-specific RNA methylase IME4